MKGRVWKFFKADPGAKRLVLLAEAHGELSESHARVLGHLLADDFHNAVEIVPPGKRTALPNPTLVAHGKARAAKFHLLTPDLGTAVADFYTVNERQARSMAQAISNALGVRLILAANPEVPTTDARTGVTRPQLIRTLGQHPIVMGGGVSGLFEPGRRNPREPQVGEVWTTLRGGRCKIVAVSPTSITVTHLETGNRERIDRADFFASYRPPRRLNPARGPRGEADPTGARELELYIDNDADLYRQQQQPILKNLWRKMVKGTYDFEKSVKLVKYLADNGAKKYAREFGGTSDWSAMFNVPTRLAVARSLAQRYREQLEAREFDWQTDKGVKRENPKRRNPRALSVPEKHQLRIARDTLKMSEAMARVMGGPSHAEARAIILRLTGKPATENPRAVHLEARTLPDIARRALAASFPSYKGRKFTLRFEDQVEVNNIWQDGSKTDTVFVRLDNFERYVPPDTYRTGTLTVRIPEGIVAVQHTIFRGDDMGIDFIVPESASRLFPMPSAELTTDERIVLVATAELVSSARFAEANSKTGITQDRWSAAKATLIGRKLLNKAGAITPAGLNAIEGGPTDLFALGRSLRTNPIARSIDRRSIRSIGRGGKRMLVGCPKRHYHPRARGRRKCDVGMRRVNPRRAVARLIEEARETFHSWHEFPARSIMRVKGPDREIPPVLVKLGDAIGIDYRSDKYAGGPDNPTGRRIDYTHSFKKPLPILATDPAGKHLYLVGGKVKITPDGLVN